MALFHEAKLRGLAKGQTSRLHESVSGAVQKSMRAASGHTVFDVFLSHSYLDRELILGVSIHLENLGYSVYVDWQEDTALSRTNVTKATAAVVRRRITQSKSLFFATTAGAGQSKWMPWELGVMDGQKGKSAILPISQLQDATDYKGQEYLGIYPYVGSDNDTSGKERLWIHEDQYTYVVFEAWLNDIAPFKRKS